MSADGMAIVDTTGRLLVANSSLAQMLGYSISELKGLNIMDIIHPDSLAEVEGHILTMNTTGGPLNSVGARVIAKDGSTRTLSWSASPSLNEGLVYAVARDVTEHKQYELAMAQLAAIVEQADYAILSLTTSGRILTWNKAAEQLWGYSQEQAYGADLTEYIEEAYRELFTAVTAEVAAQGNPKHINLRYQQLSGCVGDLVATVSPLCSAEGTINGLSVIARDCTRQKAMEQEMARLSRLDLAGQMAAGIGHEIRNPMTTVRGFLQLFQTKPDLANYQSQFELIISELDRCNFIITEFLSLAKNRVVSFKHEQLNTIVKHLEPLIQADALMGDLALELRLGGVPTLLVDAKEIRQLILNLVRNGMEAMAKTGGVLTISTRVEGAHVLLEVADQGSGIPSAIAEQIGTPFFTTKDSGTGLGLAVCHSIAHNHQATIDFVSSPLGTTFTVRFPVSQEPHQRREPVAGMIGI